MNRISNSKKVISGLATLFALSLIVNTHANDIEWDTECTGSPTFASSLTSSFKAQSDCDETEKETVSWFDWIGGKTPSYQFHFLDLLELLYDDESYVDSNSQTPRSSI
jgi:hypothetical protein